MYDGGNPWPKASATATLGSRAPVPGLAVLTQLSAWASVGYPRLGTCLTLVAANVPGTPETSRDRLDLVDAAIRRAAQGELPHRQQDVAELVLALCDHDVRDASLVQSDMAHTLAARQLWTALVRDTPQPDRAIPASLLACTAYLLGDGDLARYAIDSALDLPSARPRQAATHPMVPPETVRRAAERTAATARHRIHAQPT